MNKNSAFAQPGYACSGWNVLVYWENSNATNLNYYNFSNYLGYYPTPDDAVGGLGALPPCTTIGTGSFQFNTANDGFSSFNSPSSAPGYVGAVVPNDGFTIWAKKTCFPCGYYKVYLQYYDDGYKVKIDQDGDGTPEYTQQFSHPPCTSGCQSVIWEGYLGQNSKVDIQGFDWYNDNTEFQNHIAFLKQPLDVTATNSGSFCPGQSISLTATPTPNPTCLNVSYSWTGPNGFTSTNQNPTINNTVAASAGLYTVSVSTPTNACGNTPLSASTTVNLNTITTNAGNDSPKCIGETVNLTCSTSGATYSWSGPNGFSSTVQNPSISNISNLSVGTYTVTVTSGGCSTTATTNVSLNSAGSVLISASKNPICAGETTTLSVIGGGTYNWSNLQVGSQVIVGPPTTSTYSVTTSAGGCTVTKSITVTVNPIPAVSVIMKLPVCVGIPSTISSNQTVGNFLWSTGATTPTITFTPSSTTPSSYKLTFTDANGCSKSATMPVNPTASPTPAITGKLSFCAGSTTTLTATPAGATYKWSNGSILNPTTFFSATTATVTVTQNGCPASTSVTLTTITTVPGQITASKPAVCKGDTVTLTASGGTIYLWDDGSVNPIRTLSPQFANIYKVTVSDVNGCPKVVNINIIINPPPVITLAKKYTFCEGDSVEIKATASSPSTYNWSNGITKSNFFAKKAGFYVLTITDAKGCTDIDTTEVIEEKKPTLSISGSKAFCSGSSTTLTVTSLATSILWSDGTKNNNIVINKAGNYSITVTNSKGCKNSENIIVTESSKLNFKINGEDFCLGGGSYLFAGNFKSYLWSTGETTKGIYINTKGKYCVTVSDGFCTGDTCIDINVKSIPKLDIEGKDSVCAGFKVDLEATSGAANYQWSNGSNTPTISVSGGNYCLTVTYVNGCQAWGCKVVKLYETPNPVVTVKDKICPGENLVGTCIVNTSGFPLLTYDYLWSNGDKTSNFSTKSPGDYTVTVTNIWGCTASKSVTITQGDETKITIDTTICENSNFIFRGKIYDKNKLTDTIIIKSLKACDSIFYINVKLKPIVKIDLKGSTSLCTPQSIDLTIDANGYQGVFSVEYSANGIIQPVITNLKDKDIIKVNPLISTTYKINKIIFSSNGCDPIIGNEATIDVGAIKVNAKATTNFNGYSVKCNGGNEGQASLNINNGKKPFTIVWDNGATTEDISNLKAGRYKVTVTDINGCEGKSEVEITEPKPISFQLLAKAPTCNDPKSATITIDSIKGGAGILTYSTNNSNPLAVKKTNVITGLEGGAYEIQLKDENGCSSNSKISIPKTQQATLSLGEDQFLSLGDSIKLEPVLNFSPNKITWKNSKYLSCNTCLKPTSKPFNTILYTLTVADSTGCEATDQVTIYVDKKRPIFIPSSFSPNEDGINDFLILYADLKVVLQVKSFRVYDRWGNIVFEKLSFKPNDPAFGWDGTFKNSPMDSAIFTYSAEVEFVDNEVIVFKGDVCLVR